MRPVELTVIEGGIQRLRTKGGASPKSLYDLVNGYVTADRKVKSRPGTFRHASLPPGTKGLTAFDGRFHVFAHQDVPGLPEGFDLHILQHPDSPTAEIARIHFAEPFMGSLYVVAEFDVQVDGEEIEHSIYHFWLQEGDPWEASTEYRAGKLVTPTVPNGYHYRATRLGTPNPSWTANTPVEQGDLIEPTVYNDFYYEAVQVLGDSPRTGDVEPDWPTTTGEQVIEDVSGTENSGTAQPPQATLTPELEERYARSILSRFKL